MSEPLFKLSKQHSTNTDSSHNNSSVPEKGKATPTKNSSCTTSNHQNASFLPNSPASKPRFRMTQYRFYKMATSRMSNQTEYTYNNFFDIVCIQEHWLFQFQITDLADISEHHTYHGGIVGFNLSTSSP